jgi:hypothetical protein
MTVDSTGKFFSLKLRLEDPSIDGTFRPSFLEDCPRCRFTPTLFLGADGDLILVIYHLC